VRKAAWFADHEPDEAGRYVSMASVYAAQVAMAALPRPPSVGWRLAANAYGASYTVPYGRYQGDGLVGISELWVRQGQPGFETEFARVRELSRGYRGLRHLNHGWSFEPGGMLREYHTVVKAEIQAIAQRTDCGAVVRYAYTSRERALAFQNRGIEQVCTFSVSGTGGAELCRGSLPAACQSTQPTSFWSTDGQVSLDMSDRAAPVMHPRRVLDPGVHVASHRGALTRHLDQPGGPQVAGVNWRPWRG